MVWLSRVTSQFSRCFGICTGMYRRWSGIPNCPSSESVSIACNTTPQVLPRSSSFSVDIRILCDLYGRPKLDIPCCKLKYVQWLTAQKKVNGHVGSLNELHMQNMLIRPEEGLKSAITRREIGYVIGDPEGPLTS